MVVAGTDAKVVFYDLDGLVVQKCDYSQEEQEKEYTSASCSPSGQSVVLGSFNRYTSLLLTTVVSHPLQVSSVQLQHAATVMGGGTSSLYSKCVYAELHVMEAGWITACCWIAVWWRLPV